MIPVISWQHIHMSVTVESPVSEIVGSLAHEYVVDLDAGSILYVDFLEKNYRIL